MRSRSLLTAILFLGICVTTWLVCTVLFSGMAYRVLWDVERLRALMRERAEREIS